MMPRQVMGPVLQIPQTSTCPWAIAQTRNVCLAFGGNRPLLSQAVDTDWSLGEAQSRNSLESIIVIPTIHIVLFLSVLESPVLPLFIVHLFSLFLPFSHHLASLSGTKDLSGVVSGVLCTFYTA